MALLVLLLIVSVHTGQRVRIPRSPNPWDIELLDGRKVKWGTPQLTYSVEALRAEFNRPIYLTAWLMPSLLINKQAGFEEYCDFIDEMVNLDGPNSLRGFGFGVWERNTVDVVRFPFIKVNGKFDLERINPVWLAETLFRIRYFVERGGTMIYTLVDGCSLYHDRDGWWKYHPWNGNNNINGTGNESKMIRHMYNWTDRGIPFADVTKHYVLKFMTDMVEILEAEFPGSIVYDFNEFGSGDSAHWYLNVDRDVFQKFGIPRHRKMFSMMGTEKKMGAIAEIMTEYIWQPHGISNLEEYQAIYQPGPGLVHPSADGRPPASREQAKLIIFNSLMDHRIGFENNRLWVPDNEHYWEQVDWDIALGIKEGFLMWYESQGGKMEEDKTKVIMIVENGETLETTLGALQKLARGFKKAQTGPEAEKVETYEDLGWMNVWGIFPLSYQLCKAAGHKRRDVSHCDDGSHHEVICDICKLVYHYDSSG